MDMASVEFHDLTRQRVVDLQIPLYISCDELVYALKKAYDLPIDLSDVTQIYMRSENPVGFIAGRETLESIGITHGTQIFFEPRRRL